MDYLFEKYGYSPDKDSIDRNLEIIASNIDGAVTPEILRNCFGMMDLTSLKNTDTPSDIRRLVAKVDAFRGVYPDYPNPASICVFPNFVPVIRSEKKSEDVHITAVAGVFPHSQSFLEVKLAECRMAVEAGADEIDVVIALNAFLEGDYERASAELRAIRAEVDKAAAAAGRKAILKVILETGLLVTPENIAAASFLAMEAGADFIKTSTGKTEVSATPMAAYIMCECISAFYRATSRKVGFKPAGGMVTSKDAASYYFIVSAVLGKDWLNKGLFRFGVSRMANNLLTDLRQERTVYF